MASPTWNQYDVIRTNMPNVLLTGGTIGTNNATPTVIAGKNFTVSKNGTAHYRITFNRKLPRFISAVGIYCNTGTALILKKVPHTEGNNFVEFVFENTSGTATEPGNSDQFEFMVFNMTHKLPKV